MRAFHDAIGEADLTPCTEADYEPLQSDSDNDDPNCECPECGAPAGELCHWECDYLERIK